MSVTGIVEILDRAHSGPVCSVKEWDTRLIPTKVSEKLKEHGLMNTCTPDNPINTDDGLADKFFRAGYELALETGMLCIDTERIIKVTEEELKELVKTRRKIPMGEGVDRVVLKPRKPESPKKPVYASPFGIVVSEDLYVPLVTAIAKHREIDILEGPSLETVFGRPIKTGTPYETLAGRYQAQLFREAVWRAGRPGIGAHGIITSPTEYGQLGGYGIPGGYRITDFALSLAISELKTSYMNLHKVVQSLNCGGLRASGAWSMIGGSPGPVEGATIVSIAFVLLLYIVHQSTIAGCNPYDIRYLGNTGRDAQWANSICVQALSRNTEVIVPGNTNHVAGPCTDMLLYESVVGMANISASGASYCVGPRSAGGKYFNYISPLECKFNAEVFKKSAGLKRSDVNEIVKKLIPKYEENLKNPPKGKSFTECYNIKTLKPTQEWLDIYLKVKKEAIDLGIPLDYP